MEPASGCDLRLHGAVQTVRGEHSGARANNAGYLDRRSLSALWRAPLLPADRHLSRQAFVTIGSEAGSIRKGRVLMGEMRRAIDPEIEDRRKTDRFASTLVIAAAIIAAVRLARDDISRPSPRMTSVVSDSIGLARMILDRIVR